MKTVRVGVAGLGFGAAVHLPGMQSIPGVEVVAIAGRRVDAAKKIAARHGVEAVAGSWQELLDRDLDAVTFALPPMENERACRSALARRIGVFSEKPLAASAEAAAELSALAKGIPSVIDFEFAELEAFRRLKSLTDAKRLGDVRHVQVTWLIESLAQKDRRWSWKTDRSQYGGVTTLLGSHLLYLLEWLFGRIQTIESRLSSESTARFAPTGSAAADDRVDLWVRHANGVSVTATYGNACPSGPGHRWDCICEEGTITLNNSSQDYVAGFELTTTTRSERRVEFRDESIDGVDGRLVPFRALAARFIDAVRSGGSAQPDFAAGARVQELIQKVVGN